MNQIENKMNMFTTAVLEDAEREKQQILKEIDEARKEELSSAETFILEELYKEIQSEVVKIKNNYKQMVSKEIFDYKRQMLKKREDAMDSVFENVIARVNSFVQGNEYKDFLVNTVKKSVDNLKTNRIIVFLNERDLKFADYIAKNVSDVKMEILKCPTDIIGGLIIKYAGSNIILDETFDYRLEKAKEDFVRDCGLTIEEI